MRPLGHAKADRHDVEESRLRQLGSLAAQVVASFEDEFVFAGQELVAGEQRRIAAAVGIGGDLLEQGAHIAFDVEQRDRQPFSGLARCCIEDMGGEASAFSLCHSLSLLATCAIVIDFAPFKGIA